jgi:hypothetical protein
MFLQNIDMHGLRITARPQVLAMLYLHPNWALCSGCPGFDLYILTEIFHGVSQSLYKNPGVLH